MAHHFPRLSSCSLAPTGLTRHSRLHQRYRPEGYEAGFDQLTLWYDALVNTTTITLICPRLNNLWPLLRTATWRINGTPIAPPSRRLRHARHELLIFNLPPSIDTPQNLTVQIADTPEIGSLLSPPQHHWFARTNAGFVMSRDNDLQWIEDFCRYHHRLHAMNALFVIDNGSTRYTEQAVAEAASRGGIATVAVLSAPFPYGPRGRKPYARAEKYLQTALFNLLRLRFLGEANAVLNCDLDELLHTPGTTIFQLAQNSRLGYVRLPGEWRYSHPDSPTPTLHSAHRFQSSQEGQACPTKWCLLPQGPLAGYSWDTHRLEDFTFNSLARSRRGRFWHCFNTTTGWKPFRTGGPAPDALREDPEIIAALAQAFP